MAISEQRRHDLHQKLREVLGPDQAAALMEHLPPTGWADVSTKADLDQLAALTKSDVQLFALRLGARLDAVEAGLGARLDAVEAGLGARIEMAQLRTSEHLGRELSLVYKELASHTRTVTFACIGAVMTSSGLAFAAARL